MASTLVSVIVLFASLSLMALGGGSAVIPDLHAQSVGEYGWLTDQQFIDLYALTQITPGPSMLVVSLIGYKAAGWLGMVAATIAMFAPSSILTFYVRKVWDRLSGSGWHDIIEKSLVPIAVGLLFAGALVIAKGADHSAGAIVVTIVTAVLVAYTRISLLLIMAVAAVIGVIGLV